MFYAFSPKLFLKIQLTNMLLKECKSNDCELIFINCRCDSKNIFIYLYYKCILLFLLRHIHYLCELFSGYQKCRTLLCTQLSSLKYIASLFWQLTKILFQSDGVSKHSHLLQNIKLPRDVYCKGSTPYKNSYFHVHASLMQHLTSGKMHRMQLITLFLIPEISFQY